MLAVEVVVVVVVVVVAVGLCKTVGEFTWRFS